MARPYIQPIIIAEYDENGKAIEKKPRRIKLHKGPMEQEINAHTYKYVEAGQIPTPQQQNAISSDTDEVLDGSVISRLMDYRDSQLRLLIKGAMKKVEILEVDNLQYLAPIYVYDLELSLEFNDAGLKALANLMHKYIVWGVLFDWYSQLGTGGTVSGTGRALKVHNPAIKVVAVEPASSPVLSGGKPGPHKIQGIGAGFVPATYDAAVVDEVMTVENEAAFEAARMLSRKQGLLVGISSGAAFSAALTLALNPENAGKTVVAILPDTGERYLSVL